MISSLHTRASHNVDFTHSHARGQSDMTTPAGTVVTSDHNHHRNKRDKQKMISLPTSLLLSPPPPPKSECGCLHGEGYWKRSHTQSSHPVQCACTCRCTGVGAPTGWPSDCSAEERYNYFLATSPAGSTPTNNATGLKGRTKKPQSPHKWTQVLGLGSDRAVVDGRGDTLTSRQTTYCEDHNASGLRLSALRPVSILVVYHNRNQKATWTHCSLPLTS